MSYKLQIKNVWNILKIKINYFHTKRILVHGLYNEKKTKISLEGSNHSRKKERKTFYIMERGLKYPSGEPP